MLRVQAILRRGGPGTGQDAASYGGGALVIDEPRRLVTVRGAQAGLTPTEWGILVALATVPGRVYSRFELINRVRGYEFEGYERTIDSAVAPIATPPPPITIAATAARPARRIRCVVRISWSPLSLARMPDACRARPACAASLSQAGPSASAVTRPW